MTQHVENDGMQGMFRFLSGEAFSIEPDGGIQLASQSIKRFKGWVGYFRIGGRKPIAYLESWIQRRLRYHYKLRWHDAKGRCAKLQKLGLKPEQAKAGCSSRGAWRMAKHPAMHKALSNAAISKARILMPTPLRTW